MIGLEDAKKVSKFSLEGIVVSAMVTKVYDGDTVHAVFASEEGGQYHRWSCRLVGVNTPELRSSDPQEKLLATQARDALSERILGKEVRLHVGKFEKYGRLLVTIYLGEENLNEWLVREGHAVEYLV
jgi:endonuclease YncB( thermonuclease family)